MLDGIRRCHVGKDVGRPGDRAIDAVFNGGAVSSVDVEREQEIKQILVKPSATTCCMCATLDHRSFNFKVRDVTERLRCVHNEKICEQELGQRMIAVLVQWP